MCRCSTFCSPSRAITFAAYKRNKKCTFASLNYAGRNSKFLHMQELCPPTHLGNKNPNVHLGAPHVGSVSAHATKETKCNVFITRQPCSGCWPAPCRARACLRAHHCIICGGVEECCYRRPRFCGRHVVDWRPWRSVLIAQVHAEAAKLFQTLSWDQLSVRWSDWWLHRLLCAHCAAPTHTGASSIAAATATR
jgi:hypothetical protein